MKKLTSLFICLSTRGVLKTRTSNTFTSVGEQVHTGRPLQERRRPEMWAARQEAEKTKSDNRPAGEGGELAISWRNRDPNTVSLKKTLDWVRPNILPTTNI